MDNWNQIIEKDEELSFTPKDKLSSNEIRAFLVDLIEFALENRSDMDLYNDTSAMFIKWKTMLHITKDEIFEKNIVSELRKVRNVSIRIKDQLISKKKLPISEIWKRLESVDQRVLKRKSMTNIIFSMTSERMICYYSVYAASRLNSLHPLVKMYYHGFNKHNFIKYTSEVINALQDISILSAIPELTRNDEHLDIKDEILEKIDKTRLLDDYMELNS